MSGAAAGEQNRSSSSSSSPRLDDRDPLGLSDDDDALVLGGDDDAAVPSVTTPRRGAALVGDAPLLRGGAGTDDKQAAEGGDGFGATGAAAAAGAANGAAAANGANGRSSSVTGARAATAAGNGNDHGNDERESLLSGGGDDGTGLRGRGGGGASAAAAAAGGGGGGGGGEPPQRNAGEQFDHDVRSVLLLYEHDQKMDDAYAVSRFQLSFRDERLEELYRRFFGLIQEHKIRLRLLGLNFLIMLYSTIEWFSAELVNPWHLVATRSVYLVTNVTLFILSLVFRDWYREYIQAFCAILISLTALLIIGEGYLLNIVYSPIVILVLIVYLFIASAYVRMRYFIWLACSVGAFIVYDIFALTKVRDGDSFVRSGDIPRYLIVYNIVFVFVVFAVLTLSKKIEMSYRIGFANALRRYRDPRVAAARGHGGGPGGPTVGGVADDRRFMPFQEVFTSLGPKRDDMEAHSASNLAAMMEKNKYDNLLKYIEDLKRRQNDPNAVARDGGGVGGGAAALSAANIPGGRRGVPRLGNSDDPEMPEWMHPAAYIKTGYRLNYTVDDCWRSLFEVHNETVNVWTEFGPMIFFVIAWIVWSFTDPAIIKASVMDKGFIHAAIAMAFVIRPLCSGLAHLMHPISERAYAIWWAVDYASIVFTILFGSFVFGRFTFYCLPRQELFFIISAVGLSLSTTAAVIFITNSAVRIGSFFLYVLFANAVPFFYSIYLKFQINQAGQYDIPDLYLVCWLLMLVFVGIGFIIKATYIPERFLSDGAVDTLGASHQIWHILINVGNAMSVIAWHYYLSWRDTKACPPGS